MAQASITLHNLSNSDGSALYTSAKRTHTLQSSVYYPLEVPYRSDEAPTDTHIAVSLRPHNGVAMVKERYIEDVVRRVLQSIVLGEETPRCMLQTTIQVMELEADEELPGGVKGGAQGEGYLDLLVGAVNASVLGCLDGGVQMKGLVGAVLVGSTKEGGFKVGPNIQERKRCTSLHALGFDSHGRCLLMESQGYFQMEDLEAAEEVARQIVCGESSRKNGANGDIEMGISNEHSTCLFDLMRKSVEERVARDERWRA